MGVELERPTMMQRTPGGVMVPVIPARKLWCYRVQCDHRWVPADPMILWKCWRCGEDRDGMPRDGRGPRALAAVGRVVARWKRWRVRVR